eukprot:5226563-Prymnesium_polylepis.1
MFIPFLCLLELARACGSSGYVCGYVRTGPDLSIETSWSCPDMLSVNTHLPGCQHLSLTQDFRSYVKTGTLMHPHPLRL